MDGDVGRYKGAIAVGRAVLAAPSINPNWPSLLIRRRAMPMLFWLPMIFASVFLEMNGFPPQPGAGDAPRLP